MSLVYHGTRSELVARLRELAAALAGHAPDPHGVVAPVLTRGAIALLSQIQTAFLAKARGGVGSDGIKWAPLKRATIAARPIARGEKKALGVGGKRVRGLLTPAEDKRWRKIFGQKMAQLRARGLDGPEAMGIAARVAWAALKAAGAKTRLEVLGGRTVEIGRDSGVLFQSLTPGFDNTPSGAEDQVFEVKPGRVVVGSKVTYASHFHDKRPIWPKDGTLPEAWADAVNAALLRGILRAVNQIVAAGG